MTPEEYITNNPPEEERKKQSAAPPPPSQPLQLPTPPFQNIAVGARLFSLIPVFVAIGISIAVFAIIVAIGPEATTLETSPEETGTQTGNNISQITPPVVPDLPKDELVEKINHEFGLIISGNFTREGVQQLYQVMALLSRSNTFMSHLNSIRNPITITFADSGFRSCGGEVHSSNSVVLYNPAGQGGCGLTGIMYVLTHELGHIIDHRTNLFNLFRQSGITIKDGLLETYPEVNSESESFAEMIAVYIVYKNYRFSRLGRTLPEFSQKYPNYYAFTRDIIFGGVEF